MISSLVRGTLRWTLALAVAGAATVAGATAAQAAAKLSVTALSFDQASIDASTGSAVDNLTWTVVNGNRHATTVTGTVTLQMRSTVTGADVGHDLVVNFDYNNNDYYGASLVSGTPQEATFSYGFVVPRYADSTSATWEVSGFTATDGIGEDLTLSGAKLAAFGADVTAVTTPDTNGPTFDGSTSLQANGTNSGRPYLYVGAEPNEVVFNLTADDQQSGFWKGTVKLSGPAGQSVTTPFTWNQEWYDNSPHCGTGQSWDMHDVTCGIIITLPTGSATGSWRVSDLVLFDNAGVRSTFKNPASTPITVTSDATITASDFAISPAVADNWDKNVDGTITFTATGARKGVTGVYVDFDSTNCYLWNGSPSVSGDTVTVPFEMLQNTASCSVQGVAVVDGAGDVSVYGSEYQTDDLGLTVNHKPDTTAPVVTGASLDIPTIPSSQVNQSYPTLTIQALVQTAPVDGYSLYLYDSTGKRVDSLSGGAAVQAADGSIKIAVYLPWDGLAPGTYTLGFLLTDAGQLTSAWDMPDWPGSQSVPGGPVTLTVTEG